MNYETLKIPSSDHHKLKMSDNLIKNVLTEFLRSMYNISKWCLHSLWSVIYNVLRSRLFHKPRGWVDSLLEAWLLATLYNYTCNYLCTCVRVHKIVPCASQHLSQPKPEDMYLFTVHTWSVKQSFQYWKCIIWYKHASVCTSSVGFHDMNFNENAERGEVTFDGDLTCTS